MLTRRERFFSAPVLRTLALGLLLPFLSGCFSTLGYVSDNIKPRQVAKARNTVVATSDSYGDWKPSLPEVQAWAYDVADGYSSRATANRYAIYAGYFVAAASAGALLGLGTFDSSNGAVKGIPIGTGFLASVAGYYSNDKKAAIYELGSARIRDFIIQSDRRGEGEGPICLRLDTSRVIDLVNDHIRLLDPQKLADRLRQVGKKEEENAKPTDSSSGEKKAPTSAEADKTAVAAADNTLSDLQAPVKSTCDIATDLAFLERETPHLKEKLKVVSDFKEGTTERRDSAVALQKKVAFLKAVADDLVIRAGRFGADDVVYRVRELTEEISRVQSKVAPLTA